MPEPLELDGTDPGFTHWVLWDGRVPVATLRSRVSDGVLKIGRVATDAGHRRRGHARTLMNAAMGQARDAGATRAYLSAQRDVIGWYEAFGFTAQGDFYDDAGIPHRDMWKAPI